MHREMKSGRELLSAPAAGALGRRKRDPHRALGQEQQSRARWAMWDEKGWMEMPTGHKHSQKRQKHPQELVLELSSACHLNGESCPQNLL